MRPHADHFDHAIFFDDLIDEAVLDVDAPGIGACQIPNQLFKRGLFLIGVLRQNGEQFLVLEAQTRRR